MNNTPNAHRADEGEKSRSTTFEAIGINIGTEFYPVCRIFAEINVRKTLSESVFPTEAYGFVGIVLLLRLLKHWQF